MPKKPVGLSWIRQEMALKEGHQPRGRPPSQHRGQLRCPRCREALELWVPVYRVHSIYTGKRGPTARVLASRYEGGKPSPEEPWYFYCSECGYEKEASEEALAALSFEL